MHHQAALFIFPLFASFAKCFLAIFLANARFLDVCKNKKMRKKFNFIFIIFFINKILFFKN